MRSTLPVLLLLAVAGCATPERRIETRLVEAGFGRESATCIADTLTDRLSLAQLRKLSDLAKAMSRENRIERLTIREFAQRLDALGDPAIVSAVTRAGLGCALLGA